MTGVITPPWDLGDVCTFCVPLVPPQPKRLKIVFSGIIPFYPEEQEDANGTFIVSQVLEGPCQYMAHRDHPGYEINYRVAQGGLGILTYSWGPGQVIFSTKGMDPCVFSGGVESRYTLEEGSSGGYYSGYAAISPY